MEILAKASSRNFEEIYSMGYDSWGEGKSYSDYLKECSDSVKYKSGTWYILKADGEIVSSCILYELGNNTMGIGSLATKIDKRHLGYGTLLIQKIIAKKNEKSFFLWSDIDPEYYKRMGFTLLSQKYQPYESSKLMHFSRTPHSIDFQHLPKYF